MTSVPSVASTASRELNWSLSPAWSLSIRAASHDAPPSSDLVNQTRLLHGEVTSEPGSSAEVAHPDPPLRSVHAANTKSLALPTNAAPDTLIRARRDANAGTPMSKLAAVAPSATGVPNVAPPSTDFATYSPRLPVSGHMANTSPRWLVVTSPPMPVPVVSAPLTWTAACHAPDGPVRRATKAGASLC